MTKGEQTYELWLAELERCAVADGCTGYVLGGIGPDVAAWRDSFIAGMSPAEAWAEEVYAAREG